MIKNFVPVAEICADSGENSFHWQLPHLTFVNTVCPACMVYALGDYVKQYEGGQQGRPSTS